ncbi:cysteine proteinase [Zopfia rhizophila CBS 207.26]|uniref:ubiquitinyl hydrolase 1 n=1 Tax=Zopfia rhizophila CBS 207.26 TaxID=1314779 RepID=A0A6A6EB94_9PEZI|nr:cysteine proteinase [Zopfia rhizophila CBS 207.26]
MSSPYFSDRATYAQHPYESHIPDSSTSLASSLLAVLIGVYVIFKALELLGYPVWLWLHLFLQMAYKSIHFSIPTNFASSFLSSSPSEDSDSADDAQKTEMQSRGSKVLSTVFGLNSSGLLKGVKGVTGALSKSPSNAPAGLGNWDNSCYQNSVIQGMASLPSFRNYLSRTTSQFRHLDTDTTNGALLNMINMLNDPENHGKHFWIRGKLKSMSTFQQQDAQEYYSKILDALDKEVLNASTRKRRSSASWLSTARRLIDSPATTAEESNLDSEDQQATEQPPQEQPEIISNPLDGLLAQRVGCIRCGYSEGLSLIPFNCVTVPLGTNWRLYDIRECLDEYTDLELIEGVECAKCTLLRTRDTLTGVLEKASEGIRDSITARLNTVQEALDDDDFEDATLIKKCSILKKNWVQSTKSRQAVIARAPKSLVIHINRSVFDEYTGAQLKNHNTVRFPAVLDLGSWCLGSRPSQSQQLDESLEEWSKDPAKSMLAGIDGEAVTDSPFQYTLRAAVTHFGRHENGHYICYRKHPFMSAELTPSEDATKLPVQERWWRLSDEDVWAVSEEDVLGQGGVFMLFYERVDDHLQASSAPRSLAVEHAAATIPESIPLPPAEIQSFDRERSSVDDTAAGVPLPDDDEGLSPFTPPESPVLPSTVSSTPVEAIAPNEVTDGSVIAPEEVTQVYSTATPDTSQTLVPDDTETSEADTVAYDSEDAPSTQMTSDDDVEPNIDSENKLPHAVPPSMSPGPHRMRTAGESTPRRGEGGRASLPMVAAT